MRPSPDLFHALTPRERAVLSCLQLDPDLSPRTVAKLIGVKEHVVRYTIKSLQGRDIIRRYTCIDLRRAGLIRCLLLLELKTISRERRNEVFRAIVEHPSVAHCSELGGPYQLSVVLSLKHVEEVTSFLEHVSSVGPIIKEKALGISTCSTEVPLGFAETYLGPTQLIKYGNVRPSSEVELNEQDVRILKALAAYPSKTHRELAEETLMPLSTFEYRLARLKDSKIIVASYYVINPEKAGLQLYFGYITTAEVDQTKKAFLAEYLRSHPAIYYYHDVIGSWDVSFGLLARSSAYVSSTIEDLELLLPNYISSIRVVPVNRHHKIHYSPNVTASSQSGGTAPSTVQLIRTR